MERRQTAANRLESDSVASAHRARILSHSVQLRACPAAGKNDAEAPGKGGHFGMRGPEVGMSYNRAVAAFHPKVTPPQPSPEAGPWRERIL